MPTSSPRHCWRLTVRDSFAAAHALRNYNGKCESLHGHNFSVSLEIEGDTLTEDTELLMDFTVLKAGLKQTLQTLDHTMLNDLPVFATMNPSSENLSRLIFQMMREWLANCDDPQAGLVRLVAVTVGETEKQCATYREW